MMLIGIHNARNSFSERWIKYCDDKNIPYKLVNCYSNDIISQLSDCNILMWHYHHANAKDFLFAKQLLFSLEQAGKKVFPDFNTAWHFDDKVGQKYLLEAIKAPLVNSYVFYDKSLALDWAKNTSYPKVFKLRGGAGSVNVKLVSSLSQAKSLIYKGFSSGFKHDSLVPLNELYTKYKNGSLPFMSLLRGFARTFIKTKFSKYHGREIGYVYFQDFIEKNDCDIRIIVIGEKAFALKRMVRENDFRASGSGILFFDKSLFNKETVKLALDITKQLNAQCLAFDFVYKDGVPFILEISYGFATQIYDACEGYWDKDLNWYEGKFIPQNWMVDLMLP